jgi:hypothetical protein
VISMTNSDYPSITTGRPKIECDTHDLLDQANVLALLPNVAAGETATLIGKLRNSAEHANEAGLIESVERLLRAAAILERRLIDGA